MIAPFVLEAQKASSLIKKTNNKTVKCEGCGEDFQVKVNQNNIYCTPECRKKNKLYHYTCSQCKINFTRTMRSKALNVFCCNSCRWKYTQLTKKIKKPISW